MLFLLHVPRLDTHKKDQPQAGPRHLSACRAWANTLLAAFFTKPSPGLPLGSNTSCLHTLIFRNIHYLDC